ncbi:MAG: arginine--tRNA ligase, partial [Candidatus Omnitrophica bacterium]|nr:arginine--tRNA ligase [Candidatus Omnitrophota bacterium]
QEFAIESIDVAGPGFINITLAHSTLVSVIDEIRTKADGFGAGTPVDGRRFLVEYVSANPTGPLTIAHGRQAAFGDSLLRILRFVGYQAESEYYNNDVGVQIQILGESVLARCRQLKGEDVEFPENGYKGDYIRTLAQKLLDSQPDTEWMKDKAKAVRACSVFARDAIGSIIRKDLEDFRVHFDCYYSQETLDGSGKVEAALEALEKSGNVFEADGAKWLRSTEFGDDKDRVVVKSDGSYTYLMPDIAYHREKFLRGYTDIVDILGPDHHGYIKRLKASQKALGFDPDRITVLIAQLVTLYEGEKQLKMSTRAGEFVTLRELIDEVGPDAARFFFLTRKCDSHLDFDLALAKKQSSDNPVFYIQYAHARISNFQSVFEKKEISPDTNPDLSRLSTEDDIRVLRMLRKFHKTLRQSAESMDPHALIEYLQQLAACFHQYYQKQRIADPED